MRQLSKEVKAIILVILFLWTFAMGWVFGDNHGYDEGFEVGKQQASTPVVVPSDQPSTENPTPTEPPSTAPQPSGAIPINPTDNQANPTNPTNPTGNGTTPTTPNTPGADASNLSKAQIIAKMNDYVKKLKAEQNFTARKVESVKIEVVDFSLPSAVSVINNIINGLAGDEEITYTFSGGKESGGGTPHSLIPPTSKDFLLTDAGVVNAAVKKDGANTVYTVTLAVEETTLESPIPAQNSTAIGFLDLTSIDLPSIVTITKANMHYPGSTVEVVVNANDQVVTLVNKLPMTGEGSAKVFGMEGTASFQGGLDETWYFTY